MSTDKAVARRVNITHAYAPRPIRFLGICGVAGWQLKAYGIAFGREYPAPDAVEAAKQLAATALPQPPTTEERYGVGFLTVHQGKDACWALIDWWAYEDVLCHKLYRAPLDHPTEFTQVTSGPTVCVWELNVLAYERNAWVETMLQDPKRASVMSYLARSLSADL